MPLRPPAGFISAFYDPLKTPNAPTSPSAVAQNASADVSFTAPANVGGSAITAYYAVSDPGQFTTTGAASPITVTGLTNGTAYTFNVWALNSYGPGPWSVASGSVTPAAARGIFGGYGLAYYITIPTLGSSTGFGTLTPDSNEGLAACASTTRGLFAGGYNASLSAAVSAISYVTIATAGNSTFFGNLSQARYSLTGANNATRGIFVGGQTTGSTVTTGDYVTIATTGNSSAYAGLSVATSGKGAVCSPTRAVYGGGVTSGTSAQFSMGYFTTATTGNMVNFGNLTSVAAYNCGASNSTRGLFAGGYDWSVGNLSMIDYITIATTGNASSFGSLTVATHYNAGVSDANRAVFTQPASTSSYYVQIATTGNTSLFGAMNYLSGNGIAGMSNANGGTQ